MTSGTHLSSSLCSSNNTIRISIITQSQINPDKESLLQSHADIARNSMLTTNNKDDQIQPLQHKVAQLKNVFKIYTKR